MKVKELVEKYSTYMVSYQGFPDSRPFSDLPKELENKKGKELDALASDFEVKGYDVENRRIIYQSPIPMYVQGLTPTIKKYDGILTIYLISDKNKEETQQNML